MLSQYFTFDELEKEYGFSITSREIKVQVKAAYVRQLYIIPAFKKGKTHFKFTTKEETEQWLKEPFTPGHNDGTNYKRLLKHYGLEHLTTTKKDFINFMKGRGIQIQLDNSIKPAQFKVINDNIFHYNWVPYPKDPNYEVCKEGYVRNRGSGYLRIQPGWRPLLHRGGKLVFPPLRLEGRPQLDRADSRCGYCPLRCHPCGYRTRRQCADSKSRLSPLLPHR